MGNEIIETELEKRENNDLVIAADEFEIQFSPEARDAVSQLGAAVLKKTIDANVDKFIFMVQNEVEVQVRAMEKTVEGQAKAFDVHERKQHELLVHYTSARESLLNEIAKSQTPEEKAGFMKILENYNAQLEELYISNNNNLDSNLEHVKQNPKGIIGHVFSWLGW